MEATIDGAGRVVIPKRLRDEFGIAPGAWFETFSVLTRLPGPARRDEVVGVQVTCRGDDETSGSVSDRRRNVVTCRHLPRSSSGRTIEFVSDEQQT